MNSSVDITFDSVTQIRALAISGIIVENYLNALGWNNVGSVLDMFTSLVATIGGTFVHMFFILSGYGLTLSCLKKETFSWTFWARERFRKIIVPFWVAVVITYFVANISHAWAPISGQHSYSAMTLFAYLTFLRNFYEPGWTLNPSFWFMPVLIGLYVLFPVMLLVMKRVGMTGLLFFSLLASNASIAACVCLGYTVDHQSALPLYFIDEFAVGMILAHVACYHPRQFQCLPRIRFFVLGIALCAISIVISKCPRGGYGSSTYNDIFEATGLFLVLLFICRWMRETLSLQMLKYFDALSRMSYIMYLIHWPIIVYGLEPFLGTTLGITRDALIMLLSAGTFVLFTFFLALGISFIIEKFKCAPKFAFLTS